MSIVSFSDYEVPPRFDGTSWTTASIYESATKTGSYTLIDTLSLPVDPDPANPQSKSFTTEAATMDEGWYQVKFRDADLNVVETDPVFNAPPASYEILASLSDINAFLDDTVIEADANNSSMVQISVNRVVKGYLARVIDPTIMATWTSPDATPDIIREIAGMLIAAQVYANETAKSTTELDPNHYSQILYNRVINTDPKNGAPGLLDLVLGGEIPIPSVPTTPIESLTALDYFPVDDTDRAFSMGMNL